MRELNSKGFTFIEMLLTVIVVSILSAFTFSVVWQYSNIYASAQGGRVYAEAAAAMERMTRELRDASAVDSLGGSSATFINFQLTHGTPSMGYVNGFYPYCPPTCPSNWVQYCTCTSGGVTQLYRLVTSQNAGSQCTTWCPPSGNAILISRNIMAGGFQIRYMQGNGSGAGPEGDSYEITLKASARSQAGSPSITLVSRVSPRNYTPYDATNNPSGIGSERDFGGGYYDRIK
jgi:prepilin-type N-terminal cleavage/methylation domain-containing protein